MRDFFQFIGLKKLYAQNFPFDMCKGITVFQDILTRNSIIKFNNYTHLEGVVVHHRNDLM